MSQTETTGSVHGEETEAEYQERKTKEFLATRQGYTYKPHFDYRRRR